MNLVGITTEVTGYRLGNRSALEWVIDQYQVKPITNPSADRVTDLSRPDDPESIVRLVGQVVRVSMETVKIVAGLPPASGWPAVARYRASITRLVGYNRNRTPYDLEPWGHEPCHWKSKPPTKVGS